MLYNDAARPEDPFGLSVGPNGTMATRFMPKAMFVLRLIGSLDISVAHIWRKLGGITKMALRASLP